MGTLGKHWKLSEETKYRQGLAKMGDKNPAKRKSVRDKISETQRGRKQSPETIRKRSESLKGHVMSKESRLKISKTQLTRREKHWSWKGGVTPENKRIRFSAAYKYWREMVFNRDKWSCQKCGEKAKIVQAHHIKSFAEHPELRLSLSNGITWCVKCHRDHHKK